MDVVKKKSKYKENNSLINWLLLREKLNGYNSLKVQKEFFNKCKKHRFLLNDLIKKLKAQGKRISGYGASTKGNTILQYFKINKNLIRYAAERSPEKWGKYTVGTGIKIISEKKARELNPDYFLVMPW